MLMIRKKKRRVDTDGCSMKTEDREFVRVYVLDYLQQHYPEVAAHGGAAEIKRVMREAIEALTLELAMAEAALDADHNHEGG